MAYTVIRPRHGVKTLWDQYGSRVYKPGEMLVESPDTGVGTGLVNIKFGDGVTPYKDLPYAVMVPTDELVEGGKAPMTSGAGFELQKQFESSDVGAIVSGATPAGDSNKLGGKGANEYFTKAFGFYLAEVDIKETAVNIELCPLDSITRFRLYHPTNAPIVNGDFYVTVEKVNVNTYMRVTAKCVATNRTWELTMANGVWGEWEKTSVNADLANYLPLNGSVPMTAQMFKIANGYGAVSASEGHVAICSFENSNYEGTADVLVMFNSRWGNRGIYYRQQVGDVPTDYPILHAGNVASYALPTNGGGTVTSTAGSSVINVNNESPDTSMTQMGFQMRGETYGFLGFSAFGVPAVHIPGVDIYPLLHAGNVGSYALPIDGSKAMSGNLCIHNVSGKVDVFPSADSLILQATNVTGTTTRYLMVNTANAMKDALMFVDHTKAITHTVHHDGNSAKVQVSQTPLTAAGSVRVW